MKRWILVVFVACACPSKKSTVSSAGSGEGSSAQTPVGAAPETCATVRPKVEELYRVEAKAKEPQRVEEAVADNTRMVMNDCNKNPPRLVPCLANAASVAE